MCVSIYEAISLRRVNIYTQTDACAFNPSESKLKVSARAHNHRARPLYFANALLGGFGKVARSAALSF